ncbi:MAG: hypothetical protein UHP25_02670 [Prevotella sp.]|nr:hypothetical protein [Prevotella sp.]
MSKERVISPSGDALGTGAALPSGKALGTVAALPWALGTGAVANILAYRLCSPR